MGVQFAPRAYLAAERTARPVGQAASDRLRAGLISKRLHMGPGTNQNQHLWRQLEQQEPVSEGHNRLKPVGIPAELAHSPEIAFKGCCGEDLAHGITGDRVSPGRNDSAAVPGRCWPPASRRSSPCWEPLPEREGRDAIQLASRTAESHPRWRAPASKGSFLPIS